MSGIEGKIALEAIKPATGFINALLAPKIEKLKLWATEKELEGNLDPDKLSNVMRQYLTKLSHRVSEITTISFPQIKMNIFEAYEPLHLGKYHFHHTSERNEIELANLINEDIKSCSIIDSAGMGKSTFSKFVVASLLYKSQRIPLLFELRKINQALDLVENLAKELDFPGNKFDRGLFYKLLELGKFYVILDGFDEVDLDYQEALSNQIQELSLKGGDNILILTSRPQDTLPDIVNSETFRFLPFNQLQAKSLLERYDTISGLDVGKNLFEQIDSVPTKFIESPLLVSLLYRTFGVNKSIADRICTFYDEIYHALYKGHDLINKNGYGREKKSNLDFEDFRKLLRAMCYYMMLNRKTSFESWSEATMFIEKAIVISSIEPSSPSKFLDDLLVSVPLMHRDGNEIKFFHKTLLEYFTAEYLVLYKSSSDLLKKLFRSKLAPSFDKTFEFLAEINSSLFDNVITHHFALLADNNGYGKSYAENVYYSFIFQRSCKVGLWSVSEFGKKRKMGKEDRFMFNQDRKLVENGYRTSTYNVGLLNDEKYFIVMTYTESPQNFHEFAWNSLSILKNINAETQSDFSNNKNMEQLFHILGKNTWNTLDNELIEKIKDNSSLLGLAEGALESESDEMDSVRILSKEKVDTILDKVKSEEDFLIETEGLIA